MSYYYTHSLPHKLETYSVANHLFNTVLNIFYQTVVVFSSPTLVKLYSSLWNC